MDTFSRSLLIADQILTHSPYKKFRKDRYSSYDTGKGKDFEEGKLLLEDLRNYALANGEPRMISGKQEWLENLINQYI
jgi:xylose isomerase